MMSSAIFTIAEVIVLCLRLIVANSRGRRRHTEYRKDLENDGGYDC